MSKYIQGTIFAIIAVIVVIFGIRVLMPHPDGTPLAEDKTIQDCPTVEKNVGQAVTEKDYKLEALEEIFANYRAECDKDQFNGVLTESFVKIFATDFERSVLYLLRHKDHEAVILPHVAAGKDVEDLQQIIEQTGGRCPHGAETVCKTLKETAEKAIGTRHVADPAEPIPESAE